MTALLLLTAAAIIGYGLFALASPTTGCRRCRGYGTRGRRRNPCHRCRGTGIRFRPGAPLLYRAIARYRRHRASGDLTMPPLRPPRRRP